MGTLTKTTNEATDYGVIGQRCAEYSQPDPPPPPPSNDPPPPPPGPIPPEENKPICVWEAFNYTIDSDGYCYVTGVRAINSPCDGEPPKTPYRIPCGEMP